MIAWLFTLRGIQHRPGRSLVVALLAVIATAAAVMIPLYTRAAQQSVLHDGLSGTSAATAGLTASANTVYQKATISSVRSTVDAALKVRPRLAAHLGEPASAVSMSTSVPGRSAPTKTLLAYQERACALLTFVSGSCPDGDGQAAVSKQVAAELRLAVGDPLTLVARTQSGQTGTAHLHIVGIYQPINPADGAWGGISFPGVSSGVSQGSDEITLDPTFVGSEKAVEALGIPATVTVQYPLRWAQVSLDDQAQLRQDVGSAEIEVSAQNASLASGLPTILEQISREQRAVATSVPLVALPLVLLCLFVLFLVVAALTEERSPEIAMGKLRGLHARQVRRFGLGEPLVLIIIGAPIGFALGLGSTALAARAFLAEGTALELRTPVFGMALLALLAAAVAAVLATRRTVAAGVLTLMRRVPPRSGRSMVVAEAVVGALAAVALYQVIVGRDRASTLAYLAPPLVALLAGLIAARILHGWARARVRTARAQGDLVKLLATVQLARRRSVGLVVAVLTVAVALLTFAAVIWDVAATNRRIEAEASVGADRIYAVSADNVQALLDAVRKADPGGQKAMAVVRSTTYYGDGTVGLLGVDSSRLAAVARWPNLSPAAVGQLARRLQVPLVDPPVLHGPQVEVDVTVSRLVRTKPMTLALLVSDGPERLPRLITLGTLRQGAVTYRADLSGCPASCGLLGLVVQRYAADSSPSEVTLTIHAVRDDGRPVAASLIDDKRWRGPLDAVPGRTVELQTSAQGLQINVANQTPADATINFVEGQPTSPVVLAGPSPADDPASNDFTFAVLGRTPQPVHVVGRAEALPAVGRHGLLYDLDTGRLRAAHDPLGIESDLHYEVWATAAAGPGLAQALQASGLRVTGVTTLDSRLAALGRLAPALALRLYLLAGLVAVLLAVGTVLLNAYVGAAARRYEVVALRTAGLSRQSIQRGIRAEYRTLLGVPLVIGALAGVGGAALLLPAIPLVYAGAQQAEPVYRAAGYWVPGALAVVTACFAAAMVVVLRIARGADPRVLREGAR